MINFPDTPLDRDEFRNGQFLYYFDDLNNRWIIKSRLVNGFLENVLSYFGFNSFDKNNSARLSEGNYLTTRVDSGNGATVTRSFTSKSSGKWYAEFVIENYVAVMGVGISEANGSLTTFLGGDDKGWSLFGNYGGDLRAYHNNSFTTITALDNHSNGDIIQVAIDIDSGNLWFGKNGTWLGDPVAGTGASFTNVTGNLHLAADPFGQNSSVRIRTAPSEMTYLPPTGFTSGWGIVEPFLEYRGWSQIDKGSAITLFDGGFRANGNGSATGAAIRAVEGKSSGKFYFEGIMNDGPTSGSVYALGISTRDEDVTANPSNVGRTAFGWALFESGNASHDGTVINIFSPSGNDDQRYMIAVDLDLGHIWFGRNGVWVGDPAAGTGATFTDVTGLVYPSAWIAANNGFVVLRTNPNTLLYPIPTGFSAWSTERDVNYDEVVSLLRFQDLENSVNFFDEKGISWTATGDARIRSLQAISGDTSLFLDGTGDGLRAANEVSFRAGTDDFTVEAWVYPTDNTDNLPLFSITNDGSGTTAGWSFFARHINNGSVLRFFNALQQSLSVNGVTVVPLNRWSHVAACRENGIIRLFLNGNLEGSESCPSNFTDDIYIWIGRQRGPTPSNEYGGYISHFRYTVGYARYVTGFTPVYTY